MTTQKKKTTIRSQDSIIEQIRGVGTGVGQSLRSDVIGDMASGVLNDLFAPSKKIKSQENIFSSEKQSVEDQPITSEVKKPEVILFSSQETNLNREIEAVRNELKKTVDELKEMNSAVAEVEKAISKAPVKAGTYHLSFFTRLRLIIKLFRQQVSESKVWLEASMSKKKKRGYWSMFKKHGTTFGMSSERVIATQAG